MNASKKIAGINAVARKENTNTAAAKKGQLEAKQYQRMRQSFFTNLLLLGFDKEANEKKDNVIYNEDTFVVANNKGALTVLYFLLCKLDPDEYKTRFRGIWPVFDKKQEQSFRKETCNWLNKITLEDPEATFSRLNPSLFLSPGGYRFLLFLFQLSRYVMLRSLKRDCGVEKNSYLRCPVLKTPQLTDIQGKILKTAAVRHMRTYVDNVRQSLQVHSKWHEQLGDMVKTYRILCKKVRALERKEKQNIEEKESMQKWAGDKLIKEESLKTVREDWLKFRKTLESQREECEIIKSILKNIASHYIIDLNMINARIPDLLIRVQEHQIQEQQIDNLYKEGKLNLVSLVQLLNLSLEMYYEKLKSADIPNTKDNIAPLHAKLETHTNLLQNMQTLRENMKEQLRVMKASVQESAEEASKKAIHQKLLPMEFTLNAPTPPRNFHLSDRSIPVDSPLSERQLPAESIDTPEAVKKIQMAAKENALKMKDQKKTESDSLLDQLSLIPEMLQEKCEEKKNKLHIKVTETLSEDNKFVDSTPQIKNKSLGKASLRMQIRSFGVKINSKIGKTDSCKSRSKSMSDFSEKKGVDIWADQIVDHVMGITDVDPQNINEALSMDAFISRDKLARSPVKNDSYLKKLSPIHDNIPEIEIDTGTLSPPHTFCQKSSSLSSISCLTELYNSPEEEAKDNMQTVCPVTADQRRQSSQTKNNLDISLDAYLQLPSDHKDLNLDIFNDVPCPKMHFSGLKSGEDASDCMALTNFLNFTLSTPSIENSKNHNPKDTSEQQDINSSDYFTPLKSGLHLKRTSKSTFLEEKPVDNNQNEDPVFLVPGNDI